MFTPRWALATLSRVSSMSWPHPCGRLTTPGIISSLTSTSTSIDRAPLAIRARPPSARPSRDASVALTRAVQRNGPLGDLRRLVTLAHVRALEGRVDEALTALGQAIDRGWLPDRDEFAVDISEEPSLAGLASLPRFQELRRRVLGRLAAERRKVGPIILQ